VVAGMATAAGTVVAPGIGLLALRQGTAGDRIIARTGVDEVVAGLAAGEPERRRGGVVSPGVCITRGELRRVTGAAVVAAAAVAHAAAGHPAVLGVVGDGAALDLLAQLDGERVAGEAVLAGPRVD